MNPIGDPVSKATRYFIMGHAALYPALHPVLRSRKSRKRRKKRERSGSGRP